MRPLARPAAPRTPPPLSAVKRKIEEVSGSHFPYLAPRAKAARPSPAAPRPSTATGPKAPGAVPTASRPPAPRSGPAPPGSRPPAAKAEPPLSSVEAARRGHKSGNNDAIKQTVKLRKVEALTKQLLDEWTSLSKEKKEEAFSLVAKRFVERAAPEYLVSMAEQFAAAADGGDPGNSTVLEEAAGEGSDENAEEDGAEIEEDGGSEADGEEAAAFAEVMKEMLQRAEDEPVAECAKAWSALGISRQKECGALTALLEAALSGSSSVEAASSLVIELTRSKKVEMRSVELALQAMAQRLEEFVVLNDGAWHLHSQVIALLFPKTPSTTWGFQRPGWTWTTWWSLAEKVMSAADRFRAFDVLVMVLQICQEKSEAIIKQQQAWKEGGRAAKVQRVLCTWAEMDNASITETLAAYGVEL